MRLKIVKAGINGEGIAFYKKKPVFIDGCFPDETVECQLEDQGRYYRGQLERIIIRSPYRITPQCHHQRKCGGCALMPLEYEQQLKIKKQLLEGALQKYADYYEDTGEVIPSPRQSHYRNKCNLPLIDHDGILVNAMYQQGSNHPALIRECTAHEEGLEKIRIEVLNVLNEHHCHAYNHKEKSGFRQLVIRGFDDEYQLVLITGNDNINKDLLKDLKKIDGIVSIFQGVNTHKNPVRLMPDRLHKLWGKDKIRLKTGNYELTLSPQAFFQLNHDQAERIYQDAADLLKDEAGTIVEAYCGIGAISLYLHDRAKELIGIEIIDSAVKDAQENAKLNGIDNTGFICGDAAKEIRKIAAGKKIDVLIADPPRTGLDGELIKTILKSKISQIIYISCNPATLGKDLDLLKSRYRIDSIKGYDMFPDTPHIETIVLLQKLNS